MIDRGSNLNLNLVTTGLPAGHNGFLSSTKSAVQKQRYKNNELLVLLTVSNTNKLGSKNATNLTANYTINRYYTFPSITAQDMPSKHCQKESESMMISV